MLIANLCITIGSLMLENLSNQDSGHDCGMMQLAYPFLATISIIFSLLLHIILAFILKSKLKKQNS